MKKISMTEKMFLDQTITLNDGRPKHLAQSVCQEIPISESKFYKNGVHLSTAVNHIEEILHDLIA
ncbi:hypothetical protein LCGC14_1298980 [marine sediment metagenome]|uniref:Uncharacterized protein n=1 Tax=marine sediment metagenome TaxID=412755 RepID=A0A0F9KQL3_9ZZZZ|nr:hypothetical protein [bacterium]